MKAKSFFHWIVTTGLIGALLAADDDAVSWGPMLVEYIARANPNGPDDPLPPQPRPKVSSGYALFLPVTRR